MITTILLLIGTSSAGKSTLAKELQAILPDHYLLLGLDDVFRMVAPRWGGGLGGPLSVHGFRYNHSLGEPIVTIRYGAVGRAVLDGMHHAVAAFAQAGTNVIVDDMLLDRDVLSDWARALAPYQTYLVKVHASLATLEERETHRRNPAGLARGHYAVNDVPVFDRLIDTTTTAAVDAANNLMTWLQTNPQPVALQQYRT
jgi:chloramphenicol 3-O phosphotransferase